jgi:hypothetical protein
MDGSLDLYFYGKEGERFEGKGFPGHAKAFVRQFNGAPIDITDSCTITRSVVFTVGKEFAGQTVYLNEINDSFLSIARGEVDAKGKVTFKNVGCVPHEYDVNGKRVKSDGLLFAVSRGENTRDQSSADVLAPPLVVSPAKVTGTRLYEGNTIVNEVDGFAPNQKYRIYALGKNDAGTGTELHEIGYFTTDKQGVMRLPLSERHAIWVEGPGDNRPYVLRKEKKRLLANRH